MERDCPPQLYCLCPMVAPSSPETGVSNRTPSSGLRRERTSLCHPACLPSTASAVSSYHPGRKQPLFQKRHDLCLLSFVFLNGRHSSWLAVQLPNNLLHSKPLANSLSSGSCPADGVPSLLLGFLTPSPVLCPLSGVGCDWKHPHLVLACIYFLPLQGSK